MCFILRYKVYIRACCGGEEPKEIRTKDKGRGSGNRGERLYSFVYIT